MPRLQTMTLTESDSRERAEVLFRQAELRADRGDSKGSFEHYMAAAKLGNVLCQLAVGNLYAAGKGVKKNPQEAARWYRTAYRNGLSAGALNLSVDLREQGNLRGAVAWLKRAIAMEDGEAYVQLAKIHLRDRRGVKSAVPLLRKALELSRSHISDDSRSEAASLLRDINGGSAS